ncbi:MAG: hypothetical protein ACPGJD_04745 [Candidatus Poseidoniaceae archaeon]
MKTKASTLAIVIILTIALPTFLPSASADDDYTTATILMDSSTSYICSPDCGPEGVDEFDWYRVTVEPYTISQIFVENLDDIASVTMRASVYTSDLLNPEHQFEIDANNNESVLLNNSMNAAMDFYVEITTIDGWGDDGSNYVISRTDENDNFWQVATPILPGSFLPEGLVCISDCQDGVLDGEDWYQVAIDADQQIAVVAEELSWFTYLDFELYRLVDGNIETFAYEYHGGSAGGLQDYSVRAWFNTTEASTYFIRVYTSEPDPVLYNLSVSIGTWVDVVEDDFHWVSFPNVKFGDEIRVQAVRTDTPNDLDVLMFNANAFEEYRLGVADGTGSSPEELLAEEDCLVCSIQFTVTPEESGILNVRPQTTHDAQQEISWSPTLFLVADYTDYRSNPPSNSEVDVASIFLSISVLESQSMSENYQVFQEEVNGDWTLVHSGTTSTGTLQPPMGGWLSNVSEIGDGSTKTVYKVEVRDGLTNQLLSDSTFEVTNLVPVAKMQLNGDVGGTFKQGLPVIFDGTTSWDGDNDHLSYSWMLDGVELSTEPFFEAEFMEGDYLLEFKVEDVFGAQSRLTQALSVEPISLDGFSQNVNITVPDETVATITTMNVNMQETSIAPSWTDFEFISTGVGIGINVESRITQTTQYDLTLTYIDNQTSFDKVNQTVTTETALKMNLAVFIRDLDTNNVTIYDMPMPSEGQVYEGQPWFPVGLFEKVYYWGDLAVIDTTTSTSSSNTVSVDVEIPALDLMDYITSMASYIPGSQVPLLVLGIAIDYNLYIDIDLQVDVHNNGEIVEMVVQAGSSTPETLPSTPVDLQQNESIQYFSYSDTESLIEIFGSIGLRLRIAQPAWLTTGLGFIVEDPMFLEGEWEAKLVNSSGPIGSSTSMGYALSDQLLTITVNQTVEEPPQENETENNTEENNSSGTNETTDENPLDNTTENQTNETQDTQGDTETPVEQPDDAGTSSEALNPLDYALYGGIVAAVLVLFMIFGLLRRKKPPKSPQQTNQPAWEFNQGNSW